MNLHDIDVPDLLDRAAICYLKVLKTGEDCVQREWKQREFSIQAVAQAHPRWPLKTWFEKLVQLHSTIWKFEHPLRKAKPLELTGLDALRAELKFTDEEIFAAGIASLHVRQINRERIALRNAITDTTGSGYTDIRMNTAT